jgi:transcription elongation factor S-II
MSSITKIENSDLFRSNIRKKLNERLKNERNSLNLEKGIFNYSLKEAERHKIIKKWDNKYFIQIYIDRLRSVMSNLNENVLQSLDTGTIKPHQIAFMTHQELCPEKWQTLIDIKIKRDKNKFEERIEAMTDVFTCRKCKSKRCTYYEQQVRSADESMTVYIQCCDCGNRWKK